MPLDQTADEPAAETAAKPRDSYTYDAATMTITGAGRTYTFSALTPAQKDAYALRGIALSVRGHRSPDKIAAEIASGKLPGRPAKKEKTPSLLRQAIAQALVEVTKKNEAPMSLEGATAHVALMANKQVDAYELHPVVNKYLNKLRPAPDLGALLGAPA